MSVMIVSGPRVLTLVLIAVLGSAVDTVGAQSKSSVKVQTEDPRFGLLTPHPHLPPIARQLSGMTEADLAYRAKVRGYAQQIRLIRKNHFQTRVAATRAEGLSQLTEFTDPAAFRPLITELEDEKDDVRLAVLDHFAAQGDQGQGALAWVAVMDSDRAIRHEATSRVRSPAAAPVLAIIDSALRSTDHALANHAGTLAGMIDAVEAIPLLIMAQAAPAQETPEGDLAWIAVQKQTVYVQQLEAIAGDNSGAFAPVLGVLNEGSILRVVDAVAVFYRTEVHYSLVSLTSNDWGQPTDEMGYDKHAWIDWYNNVYVPFKNEQLTIERLANDPDS